VVERDGLENRCVPYGAPRVRIPLSPPSTSKLMWSYSNISYQPTNIPTKALAKMRAVFAARSLGIIQGLMQVE
jgi:hypothetical protein